MLTGVAQIAKGVTSVATTVKPADGSTRLPALGMRRLDSQRGQ